MNQIYIDIEAYKYLEEWSEKQKWRVVNSLAFFEKAKVIYKYGNEDFFCYFTKKNYRWKFSLHNMGQVAKGNVIYSNDNDTDYDIKYSFCGRMFKIASQSREIYEMMEFVIGTVIKGFLFANAFLFYGNLIDDKKYIATGKNINDDKIIVFRPYKGELYAVPVGHHRSPEGVFEVRGHFRKYKSGKIVWIDSYLKGTDKEEKNDN